MLIPLNKSRSSRNRFYLKSGLMGNVGSPETSPNHAYCIVNGVDRGNGFQGYMSVEYAVNECKYFPEDAKRNLIKELKKRGYTL